MNHSATSTNWGKLSADETIERQDRALRNFLRKEVFAHGAHYRKLSEELGFDPRSIRSREDLPLLPFTTKADLASAEAENRARDFCLLPDPKALSRRPATLLRALFTGPAATRRSLDREYRPVLLTSTTGRSASPVPFLYTKRDVDNLRLLGLRIMEAGNTGREDRLLNVFPYAPHLAYWLTHHAAEAAGIFHLGTGGGKTMGTDGNARLLGRLRPTTLAGMPTFVYHLLRRALELGLEASSLKVIALGGEKTPPGLRRKLAGLAGELGSDDVQVLTTYGFTEAKAAWPECATSPHEESTGYHLSPELGIVEVVDPDTGDVLPPGEPGEIVHTPLDARGTVVLRYRTGDLVEKGLTWEPCPACGRAAPRLLGRISRVSERRRMCLGKLRGTIVDFNELEVILDDFEEIGAWQLELRKANDDPHDLDEIHLHLQVEPGADETKVEGRIRRRFRAVAELTPNHVHWRNAEDMRRRQGVGTALKEEKIVDNRAAASGQNEARPPSRPFPPNRRKAKTKKRKAESRER